MTNTCSPLGVPLLSSIRDALAGLAGALPPLPGPDRNTTHAAVSMILREGPDVEVLLIKRAEAEGDPWSGHMAFPGGRWSPSDGNLRETAIRETEEETGLSLASVGSDLGRLQALEPSTFKLPPITIFPFVFSVPEGTGARVASREVDEVLWTPLTSLAHPESRSTTPIDLGSVTRDFPCFNVGDRVVWGLTYRILAGFLHLLDGYRTQP